MRISWPSVAVVPIDRMGVQPVLGAAVAIAHNSTVYGLLPNAVAATVDTGNVADDASAALPLSCTLPAEAAHGVGVGVSEVLSDGEADGDMEGTTLAVALTVCVELAD